MNQQDLDCEVINVIGELVSDGRVLGIGDPTWVELHARVASAMNRAYREGIRDGRLEIEEEIYRAAYDKNLANALLDADNRWRYEKSFRCWKEIKHDQSTA